MTADGFNLWSASAPASGSSVDKLFRHCWAPPTWSPQFHSFLLFDQQGLAEFTHHFYRADQVYPGCLALGLLPADTAMPSPIQPYTSRTQLGCWGRGRTMHLRPAGEKVQQRCCLACRLSDVLSQPGDECIWQNASRMQPLG